MRPFSQACENNKAPILEVLTQYFAQVKRVFEIGSGTGQHAVYFSQQLPHLFWQTSDQSHHHAGINLWIDRVGTENVGRPKEFDVLEPGHWEDLKKDSLSAFDGVFSANTAHIMPWQGVLEMLRGIGHQLEIGGCFVLYGPFNRDGSYTSQSNARFDQSLREQRPHMGIRNDVDIFRVARENKLVLVDDVGMPANNRSLVFKKRA
ncbi:MAG: DUF938 domain-containing protein [Gammaproteobacteria bacterium]|nr:DUF938 domain-containing protein [Gammaproteobacteria bacterium]